MAWPWILIIIMTATGHGGQNVSMQEFTSKEKCETAMAVIMADNRYASIYCVAR